MPSSLLPSPHKQLFQRGKSVQIAALTADPRAVQRVSDEAGGLLTVAVTHPEGGRA